MKTNNRRFTYTGGPSADTLAKIKKFITSSENYNKPKPFVEQAVWEKFKVRILLTQTKQS